MKEIIILGSTGSVGTQTLEVIDNLNNWKVKVLTGYANTELLEKQIKKYRPEYAVVVDKNKAAELKKIITGKTTILAGENALIDAASENADLVLNAVVGAAGLKPSIAAVKAGNDLALANKESLVIGGNILTKAAKQNNINLLPVDSEHNAIFQLLKNHQKDLKEIILTASGGPFFSFTHEQLKNVSVKDALNHPNWEMGNKITIDSASLMNKGLEVIEAHWLFDISYDQIKVLIHPQSIVHSMIRLTDGTILAEMGAADMRTPIQYCLTYPDRQKVMTGDLQLEEIALFDFHKPDTEKFPALDYAYTAGRAGGTFPAVLNASNEVAVNYFLQAKIPFLALNRVTASVLDLHENNSDPNLDEIIAADRWARKTAMEVIDKWF